MVAPIVIGAGLLAAANMASNYLGGQQQWKKQKKMFAWQKAWEKEKMQNGVQWQMGDMKKAGINPLVAGITDGANGSGAPNPTAPNMGFGNVGTEFASAYSNLASIEQMDRNLDIQEQNADTNEIVGLAQAGKNIEETKFIEPTAKADITNKNTNTAKQTAETQEIKANRELTIAETEQKQIQNAIDKIKKEVETSGMGKALAYYDRFMQSVGGTGSAIGQVLAPLRSALVNKNKKEVDEYIETFTNVRGNKTRHRRVTSR